MDYRVALPAFHGPLDLLLHLVKRQEVDVRDLPIAALAEQFSEHIAALQLLDLELAGDFLVVAATLMEIKSRLLLPQTEPTAAEEADDPRRELVRQLIEYKKTKEAAALLEARAADQGQRLPRAPVAVPRGPVGPPPVQAVELWDLVSAFGRLMSETQALQNQQVVQDDTPQSVYGDRLRERLARDGRVLFRDLFEPPYLRVRLVGLFLAVLDAVRRGEAQLEAGEAFGEIWITPVAG